MKKALFLVLTGFLIIIMLSCQNEKKGEIKMLEQDIAKFKPTEIAFDTSLLDQKQMMVVEKLYRTARIMDTIFLKQVYSKNMEILRKLESSHNMLDSLRLVLFKIMFGPFNRLDDNKAFYGEGKKPLGANFYPAGMTKEEFQNWIDKHPQEKGAFTSEYTVIRRQGDSLVAIPYSQFYRDDLDRAARYLQGAAEYAENESLKKYLQLRADAFLSNDYYASDMAWMDLKNNLIEVVIGPYEVYEDKLFNYKASFEAFITLRDPKESEKLARFGSYLVDIEKNLPIPEKFKNFNRGSESPIVVTQEIFSAGDTKAGVQTIAFNLPNDERVRQAKGSKKVLLKNVNEAKFKNILMPIADKVLDPDELKYVTFNAFFNHTLMHEISHGVGPGIITIKGEETTVQKELKETYSTIEECKADVLGMYNLVFMIKKGEFAPSFEREIWVTFLAGIFRSVRFGISEAHGAGNAIIYNYCLENEGYEFDKATQKVRINFDKIVPAIKDLATLLLTIQAEGNYKGAKNLIAKYAVESTTLNTLNSTLTDIPVDIRPIFQIQQMMTVQGEKR